MKNVHNIVTADIRDTDFFVIQIDFCLTNVYGLPLLFMAPCFNLSDPCDSVYDIIRHLLDMTCSV